MQLEKSKRESYINLLLGMVLLTLPFLTSPDLSSGWALLKIAPFQQSFLRYLMLVAFMFINYHYIIPHFYLQKKWFFLGLILLGSYLIISRLPGIILDTDSGYSPPPGGGGIKPMPPVSGGIPPYRPPGVQLPPTNGGGGNPNNSLFAGDGFIFQFLIVCVISLVLKLNNHLKEVQNEKLLAELSYLKAQINPHFLFNILNNIYALSLIKSELTPDAILKLSGMMRYVVSESDKKRVSLEKEVKYIKDYISLQKLRLGNSVNLKLDFDTEFEDLQIAPLILITFIENAFKYGVATEEDSTITISLKVIDNDVYLRAGNTIVKRTPNSEYTTSAGLQNTQKRLDMVYPGRYELNIHQSDNFYEVELKISVE